MRMHSRLVIAAVIVLPLLASACGGGSADIVVEDAWGRTSPKVATNAAFYMTIVGDSSDDVLVSASSDACGMVQLHETVMSDGTMSMQHLPDGIAVPAGSKVMLEPGGLHLMCMSKQVDLDAGEVVEIDLVFETTDPMTVNAEIRDG